MSEGGQTDTRKKLTEKLTVKERTDTRKKLTINFVYIQRDKLSERG